MFTDMVGYTAMMQSDEVAAVSARDAYVAAINAHHAAFDGTVVQRLGDGTMSMFPNALDATHAAIAIQRELRSQDIPVRIGIHVGEVVVESERLTGDAVNVAARIESFAEPGAVILSDSAHDQVKNRAEIGVVSLGRFKLKNVGRPYELFAVSTSGVAVPDARTLEGKGERYANLPNNLPEAQTGLIGRALDVESLADLVRQHRAVTITGPGGVGKTTILVELGHALAPQFLDGLAFVPLADVVDSRDFLPALGEVLDVKESDERSVAEGVAALIGDRRVLLLLDNFEQIVDAAADIASLLERCRGLTVVTTSRTVLRISSEHEYQLAPLAVSDSVELFSGRAKRAKSSFELSGENRQAVTEICARLDGLPLALELAAARLRLLTPEELLRRLGHALDVLTSGPRDVPTRHQTLRATIDWSYSLLAEPEQRLFRRMAIFTGDFSVPDVEAVCSEPNEGLLDHLESLVDKGLVQVDAGTNRLRMLQTISEFAYECLTQAGEKDDLAMRHAQWYAKVARRIGRGVEGDSQILSLEFGVREEPNVFAALDALLVRAQAGDAAACEVGMQISSDLFLYWHIRGKNLTLRDYATAFLAADTAAVPTEGRAGALCTRGLASWVAGENDSALIDWAESYRVAETVHSERLLSLGAFTNALGLLAVDPDEAVRWAGIGLVNSQKFNFPFGQAFSLTVGGLAHLIAGRTAQATTSLEAALVIQNRLQDFEGAGLSLGGLAAIAAASGDLEEALARYGQALNAFATCGDRAEEARILGEMACAYLQADDVDAARYYFFDSAQAYTDVASTRGIGLALIGLAACEARQGRPEVAVRVAAAAEVLAHQEGIVNVYSDENPGRDIIEAARRDLGAERTAVESALGATFTMREALDLVRTADAAENR
jgi:predicted ATPase/tetratricopeptide (TPR) repeat protein